MEKLSNETHQITQSLPEQTKFRTYTAAMEHYEYDFLKTYLFNLFESKISDKGITVENFVCFTSSSYPNIKYPDVTVQTQKGIPIVINDFVVVILNYEGRCYQISLYTKEYDSGSASNVVINRISIGSETSRLSDNHDLFIKLLNESLRNSYYKNEIINYLSQCAMKILDPSEFVNEKLDNVFVSSHVKDEFLKFVKTIELGERTGINLRYLLSGKPGTGKTKSVRSLINMCYGKATIIIGATGSRYENPTLIKDLFNFASSLSPTVICLDDLDLFLGCRETNANYLGDFLSELDGLVKKNVFVLATTNDKKLVDQAASRPGRFDMIFDFNNIKNENYLDLIRSSTNNENIIEIFDDEIMNILKSKNLTGAYVVNLVKQLQVKSEIEPDTVLRNYLIDLIEMSYKGFYKEGKEENFNFGFSGNDKSVQEF